MTWRSRASTNLLASVCSRASSYNHSSRGDLSPTFGRQSLGADLCVGGVFRLRTHGECVVGMSVQVGCSWSVSWCEVGLLWEWSGGDLVAFSWKFEAQDVKALFAHIEACRTSGSFGQCAGVEVGQPPVNEPSFSRFLLPYRSHSKNSSV